MDFQKGAFFYAITSFSKELFSQDLTYIKGKQYTTVFCGDKINSCDNNYEEPLIGYAIYKSENKKRFEGTIDKKIKPILNVLLKEFKIKYDGKNLTDMSSIQSFKFEMETMLNN